MAVRFRQFISFPIVFATAGSMYGYLAPNGGIGTGIIGAVIGLPLGFLNALMLNTANVISYNSKLGYTFGLLGSAMVGMRTYNELNHNIGHEIIQRYENSDNISRVFGSLIPAGVMATLGYSFGKVIGSSFGNVLGI